MLQWIRSARRWLAGKRQAPTSARAGDAATRSAVPRAPRPDGEPPVAPCAAADDPAAGAERAFEPFARVLGVAAPEDGPVPSFGGDDARLAARVLERFAAAPPPRAASFPSIALQILELVASPKSSAADLAALVARDASLTASVLSAANSVALRGVSEIETIREAIARMGLVEVGEVAAAFSVRTVFGGQDRSEHAAFWPRWRALFLRSLAVAGASTSFSQRLRRVRSDHVYLGALLHDVGKSIALDVLERLVADGAIQPPDDALLEQVLEAVHVEIGAEAHQLWRLPAYLTVVCVRHHDEKIPADAEFFDLHVVRLTSAVTDLRDAVVAPRAAREILQSAAALGLGPYDVRALAADLRQSEARARALTQGSPGAARPGGVTARTPVRSVR